MNDRVAKLKQSFIAHRPAVSAERLVLATEAYKKYAGEPVYLFRAHVFAYVLDHKAIIINDGELLVGTMTEQERAGVVFAEYSSGQLWLKGELPGMPTRPTDPLQVTPEDQKTILEYLDYWDGKSTEDIMAATMPPKILEAEGLGIFKSGGRGLCSGCISPNFDRVLQHGFRWHIQQCQAYINEAFATPMTVEKQKKVDYWRASIIALEAGIRYSHRYADEAERQAATAEPERRAELLEIARICRKTPEFAPETFHEAIQHQWFMHLLIHIESNASANQLGRMDVHLYPFYAKDLAAGRITRERAQELVEMIIIKVNTLFFLADNYYSKANAGLPTWQVLHVCGLDAAGNDASNPLSAIILDAVNDMHMAQPPVAFRYNRKTDPQLVRQAIEMNQRGLANPAFFSDDTLMKNVMLQGANLEQARDWVSCGCQEPEPGGGISDGSSIGGYLNGPKCLELALHNGVDPVSGHEVGPRTGDPRTFTDIRQLQAALLEQIKYFTDLHLAALNATMSVQSAYLPCVYNSFLVDGCLESGRSLQEGGAKMNYTNLFFAGAATLGDSLAAIEHAVFKEKRLTMEQLLQLCDTDFQDQELQRLYLINRAPKFGNDIKEVDDMLAEIILQTALYVQSHKDCRGGLYCCGTMTQTHNVPLGAYVGATPDGRHAGTPFSDNFSPSMGREFAGPTASANSVSRMHHDYNFGGMLYNIRFDPQAVQGDNGQRALDGLVRTYCENGGYHIQMNVVDNATLLKAQEDPDNYRDLAVRVSGYLAYFTELDRAVQDTIIARTAHKLS